VKELAAYREQMLLAMPERAAEAEALTRAAERLEAAAAQAVGAEAALDFNQRLWHVIVSGIGPGQTELAGALRTLHAFIEKRSRVLGETGEGEGLRHLASLNREIAAGLRREDSIQDSSSLSEKDNTGTI
jgi:flagellar biosynthesis regulator FlaF